MRRPARLRVRAQMLAPRLGAHTGRATNALLLGLVVGLLLVLIWIGIISGDASPQTQGLLPVLQSQAIGVLSLSLIALVAWVGFRLRFRDAKLRYLQPYRRAAALDRGGVRPTFLQIVIDELVAVRPPRSMLIVSDSVAVETELKNRLPGQIASHGLVPVVVDVSDADSVLSIPKLSRECFVSRLAGATGDEPRAQRLFTQEADAGKILVVVLGLDQVAEVKPRAARRAIVASMLVTCLEERLPFVAAVPEDLAPELTDVAVVRVDAAHRPAAQRQRFAAMLRGRGIPFDEALTDAVRDAFVRARVPDDPWHLDLAADVVVARVRAGQAPAEAVRECFDAPETFRRQLSWLSERALDCRVDRAATHDSTVARAMAAIGRQAHYRQEMTTRWHDVTQGLDAEEELHFAAAVSVLSRREVVRVVGDASDPCLRFTRPEWFTFAGTLALGLDTGRWSELLSPGVPLATVDSLTAALVLRHGGSGRTDRSFLTTLAELKRGDLHDVSLDMIIAVVRAVQLTGQTPDIGGDELDALRRAWWTSTDEARLLFVSTIHPHPALAELLWEMVIPPQFQANSYRVRRAICSRLAAMGTTTWHQLAGRWRDIVAAAATADLSARARLTKPDWWGCGLPLASAAWVLPSLTDHLSGVDHDAAITLLRRMREVLTDHTPTEPHLHPDAGLEISLAEGYKLAAVAGRSRSSRHSDAWLAEMSALLRDARSWISRQVLHQALALASADLPTGAAAPGAPHPFVREAIALAQRALDEYRDEDAEGDVAAEADHRTRSTLARDIWFDDVEALADGGFELSPEAHTLLGLSTLLINLAEGAHERAVVMHATSAAADPTPEALDCVDARVLALTSDSLPRCFSSAAHTATMLDVDCDCPFRLCGRVARGAVGHRRMSNAFTQHAVITSRTRLLGRPRSAIASRAFGRLWQRPELIDEDSPG